MAFGKIYVDEVIDSNGDTLDISELTDSEATTAAKGYLSAADKTKLDGVAAGAQVNAVTSVNGETGAITVQNFTTADHTKLDGIETAATADQTKADIDALNIDADTLDGQHGSYYTGYTDTAVAGLVDSSPATLDTLNELAAALGDDPNFATTTANSIGTKLSKSGGQMTGNITFSGSQTVDGRDLSADGTKLDGISAGAEVNAVTSVNGATGAVTVQGFSGDYNDLTNKPDGSGSGLDADKVDGLEATSFLRSDVNATYNGGQLTIRSNSQSGNYWGVGLEYDGGWKHTNTNSWGFALRNNGTNGLQIKVAKEAGTSQGTATYRVLDIGGATQRLKYDNYDVWHAGNDGAGSGLDADTVDGYHSYEGSIRDARADGDIYPANLGDKKFNFTFTDDIAGSPNHWDSVLNMKGWGGSYRAWQLMSNAGTSTSGDTNLYFRTGTGSAWGSLQKVWTSGNSTPIENTFSTSAPSSPSTGDLWTDTTDDPPELKAYNGTAWIGVGSSAPTTSAPVINSVTLSESNASGDRFTSESFTVAVNMLDDGAPISQKGVKGKVVASFEQFPSTTAITARSENTSMTNVGSGSPQLNNSQYQFAFFNVIDPSTGQTFPFGIKYYGGSNGDQIWRSTDDHETWQVYSYNTTGVESGYLHTAVPNRAGTHVNFWGISNQTGGRLMSMSVASIMSGSASKDQSHFLSTDAYHYWLSYGGSYTRLYRQVKDGSTDHFDTGGSSSQYIRFTGMYQNVGGHTGCMGIETASDSIRIIGRGTTNDTLWIKEIKDSNSLNWSGGTTSYDFLVSNFDRREMGSALYHKGAIFVTYRNNLLRIADGASSATGISLPSPGTGYSTTSYVTFWEDPYGLLIAKQTTYHSASQAGHVFYFSSNNSGVSWVSNVYPSTTGKEVEKFTPDVYTYGHRAQMNTNKGGSYPDFRIQCIRLGYQDLTVTDGADLSSLNVGDAVKFSEAAPPKEHGKIMSKTSNGNGTTTVRVRTFATVNVGDTIQALASTGSATSTRFLVIDVTGAVTTHQSSDPGFVNQGPGTSHTITFPATFPTGNSPDDELPSGTTIQIDVQAINSEASDTYPSNIVTPS